MRNHYSEIFETISKKKQSTVKARAHLKLYRCTRELVRRRTGRTYSLSYIKRLFSALRHTVQLSPEQLPTAVIKASCLTQLRQQHPETLRTHALQVIMAGLRTLARKQPKRFPVNNDATIHLLIHLGLV